MRLLLTQRSANDRQDQGFTLIELLVVVIIIGILAAVAVPIYLNQRKKAQGAAMKNDVRQIAQAFETYRVDAGHYPDVTKDWHHIGEWRDWGSSTAVANGFTLELSPGVSTHAFDMYRYVPAGQPAIPLGQVYCIEIYNAQYGTKMFYRSDKGGFIKTSCQAA